MLLLGAPPWQQQLGQSCTNHVHWGTRTDVQRLECLHFCLCMCIKFLKELGTCQGHHCSGIVCHLQVFQDQLTGLKEAQILHCREPSSQVLCNRRCTRPGHQQWARRWPWSLGIPFYPFLHVRPTSERVQVQVYKARIRATGEEVAVKVQRPGIVDNILIDMLLLRRLMKAVDRALPSVSLSLAAPVPRS